MTREDIEKAAGEYSGSVLGFLDNPYMMNNHKAFADGANWRMETVWHKPNEEPISFCSLLLIENNGGEFDLKYRFDPSTTKRWAYVKDLIPIKED